MRYTRFLPAVLTAVLGSAAIKNYDWTTDNHTTPMHDAAATDKWKAIVIDNGCDGKYDILLTFKPSKPRVTSFYMYGLDPKPGKDNAREEAKKVLERWGYKPESFDISLRCQFPDIMPAPPKDVKPPRDSRSA